MSVTIFYCEGCTNTIHTCEVLVWHTRRHTIHHMVLTHTTSVQRATHARRMCVVQRTRYRRTRSRCARGARGQTAHCHARRLLASSAPLAVLAAGAAAVSLWTRLLERAGPASDEIQVTACESSTAMGRGSVPRGLMRGTRHEVRARGRRRAHRGLERPGAYTPHHVSGGGHALVLTGPAHDEKAAR